MNAKTNDTRQHILDVGYQLVVTKGFTSVGLSELLKAADVPKGSFYHYFKSKEQFGEALIEDYFSRYLEMITAHFTESEGSGCDRLLSYFERWMAIENGQCNANKCLVVKLSAEVSDLSEAMRVKLASGATQVVKAIEDCVKAGIEDSSIQVESAEQTAHLIYHQWIGASLLNKLYQDRSGLMRSFEGTQSMLKGK
ncbi:TetR/AcrR family transcriptional regulator [Vibrio owensii]|uniref:TetR family transcriptional regulator n=1 Tax=Vibrio owensii CAIM 1854 = LMG 25443 TaxID=1229493 RepID=A0A0C1ZKT2_9VIBR|nr:TetR/AcrR family transcriptional regulator [Vibrio owensii]KIF53781.1 TetR family transcriptional regulator [Vibrio owensii CAIM 1854 = LMG 25443]